MQKVHRVKCPICGLYFDANSEENIVYKRRYYHKACFGALGEEEKEKIDLVAYIVNLFNIKTTGAIINAQMKKYHEELKYSYSGIKKTLIYFYEIKGNSIENAVGIGIVPFVHDEAKAYYNNLFLIQKNNEGKAIENQTKIIRIARPRRQPLHKRKEIHLEEGEQ